MSKIPYPSTNATVLPSPGFVPPIVIPPEAIVTAVDSSEDALALARLNERGIVELDEERKAAMVSNLMVVLCGDQPASPVVNTGTLYT